MAALMMSTDKEIRTNSKLVRDDLESQKSNREITLKFEEWFEKVKRR